MSSTPKVQVFRDAANSRAVNVKKGAWVCDFSSSHPPQKPFTAGWYIKDEEAEDATFTNWPNCEWKYVVEGEWHIKQDGELLIGRPGDVVFVPEGANYSSLKNPFKAFFVANRPGADHKPYDKSKL